MKNLPDKNQKTAFTLVELLVVISIITLLAGMVLIGGQSVRQKAAIKRCQSEMQQIKSAIDTYKAKKGFYPPDNPNNLQINALLYELMGMKKSDSGSDYETIDPVPYYKTSSSKELTNSALVVTTSMFAKMGVKSFANYTASGKATDDAAGPENFYKDIHPKQLQRNSAGIFLFMSPLSGPDQDDFNPWFYNSHNPANNADGYDLWTVVYIGGKTYTICNWSDRPIAK